jgi:hypothetical protein
LRQKFYKISTAGKVNFYRTILWLFCTIFVIKVLCTLGTALIYTD